MPENIRRTAAVTSEYAQAVRDVGKELSIPVLDLWTAMIDLAGGKGSDAEPVGAKSAPRNEILQSFLRDGLHLSPEGYKVLYKEYQDLLARVYPDLLPERQSFTLPAWDDEQAWRSSSLL